MGLDAVANLTNGIRWDLGDVAGNWGQVVKGQLSDKTRFDFGAKRTPPKLKAQAEVCLLINEGLG